MVSVSPTDEIVRDCLAVRVRLISRAVTAIYDRAIDGHGVSIAQVNLLAAIDKLGPCAPTRVGDVLQLERSTVSRNVNLLLKRGWVTATASDAKGVREIALTAAGRKKIGSVLPAWRAAQQEAAQLLGSAGVNAVQTIANSVGAIPSE